MIQNINTKESIYYKKLITNSQPKCSLVRGANGSFVVNGISFSSSTENGKFCPLVLS